jgi:trimeric autotransporter adhesin
VKFRLFKRINFNNFSKGTASPLWRYFLALFAIFFAMFSVAQAQTEPPQFMTVDGRLYDSSSPTDPLLDASVLLKIQVLNPAKTCILYEEEQTVSTLSSNGYFNVRVGSPTSDPKRSTDDSNNSMMQVFQNQNASIAGRNSSGSGVPCSYTPANGDSRFFRFIVTPSSTGVTSQLSPDMTIDSVPQALVAESLQGLSPDSFIQVNANTTQAKADNIFGAGYAALTNLISGTSSLYLQNTVNGTVIPNRATDPGSPTAGQIWYDSVANALKYYNGSTVQTLSTGVATDPSKLPLTGGAMTGNINMGGNQILGVGHITQNPQSTITLGTYTTAQQGTLTAALTAANKGATWFNSDTNKMMYWDGTVAQVVLDVATAGTVGDITAVTAGTGLTGGGVTGAVTLNVDIGTGATQLITNSSIPNCPANQSIQMSAGPIYTMSCVATTDSSKLALAGGTMTGNITMGGNQILGAGHIVQANQSSITIGSYTTAQETPFVAALTAGNEGTLWFNSDTNELKYWDGAAAQVLTNIGSAGDMTAVNTNAGSGLSGGAASGAATLQIVVDNTGIEINGTNQLQLKDAGVVTAKLADNAVTAVKVANNAITSAKILDDEITNADINASAAIAWSKIDKTGANAGDVNAVARAGDTMTGSLNMDNEQELRLSEADINGANYVALKAPAIVGNNVTFTLPAVDGTNGQVLQTDGAGNLSFVAIASAPVSSVFGRTGAVVSANGDYTASQVTNVAAGGITGNTVQLAINELDTEKVAKAGDTMMGQLTMTNNITLNAQNQVRYADSDSSNYVAIQSPGTVTANYTLTLPDTAGTNGQVLSTNGSGVLSWITPSTVPANNSLDFTHFVDNMTLDASTDIAANGTNVLSVTNDGAGNSFIVNDNGSADTSPFVIDSTGRVGIGTTSPANRLDVNGGVAIGSYAGTAITNNYLVVSGRLGVGTSAPTVPLDVRGNTGGVSGVMQNTNALGVSGISLRDELFSDRGVVGWDNSADYMKIGTTSATGSLIFLSNDIERARIDSVGNVGIGTTTPAAKLDVEGTIQIADGGELCAAPANAGMVKYAAGTLQYCNGSAWQTLGVSGAGLTTFNSQTGSTQTLALGSTGLAPNWNSASDVHTLHIPLASGAGVTSGTISKTDYDAFNAKVAATRAVNTAAGSGLTGGGDLSVDRNISVNITGTTAEAVVAGADEILIWDVSANALRKMTRANFVLSETEVDAFVANNGYALATNYVAKAGDTMTGQLTMTNNITLNAQNQVRFADSDSSNYVAIQSPGTVTANYTLTLPDTAGTNGQVLSTNGSGVLSWVNASAGDITDVVAGAGLTGGAASGSATLDIGAGTGIVVNANDIAVNVGTADGQIVQVQTGGKLPALDGSDLTNLDAGDISAGTLAVNRGGTGQSTYTDGQLLIGNSTGNTLTKATLTAGGGVTVTNGNGSITLASTLGTSVDLATEVTGTLPIGNGGTGATTANGALNALLPSQATNGGRVLLTDGTNASWVTPGASLSGLTAATGTNTIANANHTQVWNWDTLSTETAMNLGTNSGTTGTLMNLSNSYNNVSSTGNVLKLNTTGASNAAVPLMITNAGTGNSLRVNDDGTDTDTSPFVIDANGRVGIGTTAPSGPLDVRGGAAPAATNGLPIYLEAQSASSGNQTGGHVTISGGSGSGIGAGGNIYLYPGFGVPNYGQLYVEGTHNNASGTFNLQNNTLNVLTGTTTATSTAQRNLVSVTHTGNSPSENVIGSINESVFVGNVSTAGNFIGAQGLAHNTSGNRTMTSATGLLGIAGGSSNNSTITTAYGGRFQALQNTGTITTGYGVYIDDVTATTPYGIYQAGANDRNFFAGNVGLGTTTPAAKLDVEGTIQIADGGELCAAPANAGMVKYAAGTLQYCNGSAWQTLGVSGAGLTTFNSQTGSTQTLAIGSTGLAPNWNSASDVHTLHIPLASGAGVTSGTISKTDYDTFNAKVSATRAVNTAADSGLSGGGDLSVDRNLAVNITGTTGLGATADNADEILVYDVSAPGLRKVTRAQLNLSEFEVDSMVSNNGYALATNYVAKAGDSMSGRLTMDPKGVAAGDGGSIVFTELAANGTAQVGFRAPDDVTTGIVWTLPAVDGSSGQVLQTNGSGLLSWVTTSAVPANNSLDFSHFVNAMSLDASTDIAVGANVLSVTNDGVGDSFVVNDNGSGDTTPFVVSANGNVGAGVTPLYALDVSKTVASPDAYVMRINQTTSSGSNTNYNSLINFTGTNGVNSSSWAIGTGSNGFFGAPVYFGIRDITNNNTSMVINPFGNVGFGETQPNSKVHIAQAGLGNAFRVDDQSSDTTPFLIDADGNVGIGTTVPSQKLDIEGTILSGPKGTAAGDGGAIRFEELAANGTNTVGFRAPNAITTDVLWQLPNTDGTSGQLLQTNGAGVLSWVSAPAPTANSLDFSHFVNAMSLDASTDIALGANILSITNDGSGNSLVVNDNGASDTSPFVIDASGNVGIGSTVPGAKLDVAGGVRTTHVDVTGSDFQVGTNDGRNRGTSTYQRAMAHVGFSTGEAYEDILNINHAGDFEGGVQVQGPRFIVEGNAGVGTTAPGSRLDVAGAITSRPLGVSTGQTGQIIMRELAAGGSETVTVRAPDAITTSYALTLPDTAGTSGQLLQTNGAGVLSWASAPAPAANSLDFSHFIDTMSLDASTSITADNAEVLSITNIGTGNSFLVNDVAGDTSPFVIDTDGNVGIGTTTPGNKFNVSDGNGYVRTGTIGLGGLRVKMDRTDSSTALIVRNGADTGLFTVLTDGNTGIGTTAPASLLEVYGNSTENQYGPFRVTNIDATGGWRPIFSGLLPNLPVSGTAQINFGRTNAAGNRAEIDFFYAGSGSASNSLNFGFSGNNGVMSVLNSGNVGIGATAPGTRLDVGGAITSRPSGTGTGQTGQLIMRELAAGGSETVTVRAPDAITTSYALTLPATAGSSGQILSTDGTGILSWISSPLPAADSLNFTEFADAMTLDANTSIAVGAFTLAVTNDGAGDSFRVNDNGGADATPFVIDASGNVGIGIATPGALLEVRGGTIESKSTTTPIHSIRETSGNSADEVLRLRRSRADSTAPSSAMAGVLAFELEGFTNSNVARAGSINWGWENNQTNDTTDRDSYLAFRTMANAANESTAGDERMRITSAGNVGIGTTAPSERLTVVANSAANDGVLILQNTNAAAYSETSFLDSSGNWRTTFGYGNASVTATHFQGRAFQWLNTGVDFVMGNNSGGLFTVQNAGNVGVGTTSPGTRLDVSGAITSRPSGTGTGQTGQLIMHELAAGGSETVTVRAPDAITTSYALTLPTTAGANGQVLSTNGSGMLSWVAPGVPSADSLNFTELADALVLDASTDIAVGVNLLTVTNDGSGLSFRVNDNGTGDTTPFVVASGGEVGIGTSSPGENLDITEDGGNAGLSMSTYASSTAASYIMGRKARGSMASPTAALLDDPIMTITGRGYGTTSFPSSSTGRFGIFAAENYTDSAQGTYIAFETTPTGSTTRSERLRITSSGNIGIGTTAPNRALQISRSDTDVALSVQNQSSSSIIHPRVEVTNYNGGFAGFPVFRGITYRGNSGAPNVAQSGDVLAAIQGSGGSDTSWNSNIAAEIRMAATQTFSSTAAGSSMAFRTTPDNSTTLTTRMLINQNGNVGIGSTAPNTALDVNGTVSVQASNEGAAAATNSSTGYTIPDISLNVRRITLNANTTLTLPTISTLATNQAYTLTVRVVQDATGGRTLAWAGNGNSIKWDTGTAGSVASGANDTTIYQFFIIGGETTWYASMVWREN